MNLDIQNAEIIAPKDLTDWILIIRNKFATFHPEMQMQGFHQS